ncbi:MAG: hypothetical protein U0930_16495 [Pirellulales bacterium]
MLKKNMSKIDARVVARLMLLGTVLSQQVGCGAEEALMESILVGATVAGTTVFVVHELHEIREAELDIELKQLRLEGIRHGSKVSTYRDLTDSDVEHCIESRQVEINGVQYPVKIAGW